MIQELKKVINNIAQTIIPTNLRNTLNGVGEKISEDHLIRFDYRVISFLVACFILFSLLVAFMIHGSSDAMWHTYIPSTGDVNQGVLIGTPKWIRFDEWVNFTPMVISQASKGFPTQNTSIGGEKSPLIMPLPVNAFPNILRPHFWGFFILDLERGYSFFWNYKVFGLLLSTFFLLMLLTRNNFWLSLSGSVWLYFSTYIQWWFSAGMDIILTFNVLTVCAIYLLFSRKPLLIVLNLIVAILYGITFVLYMYPPFQVPMGYLFLFLLAGYFLQHYKSEWFKDHLPLRLSCIFASLIVTIAALYIYYGQAKDTITLMTQTDYPGNRISVGGESDLGKYFGGFYDMFFAEKSFPQKWGNVCEASNFILLSPLVLLGVIKNFFSRRKSSLIDLFLLAYIIFMTIWLLIGLPAIVAKLTLLDRVTANRAYIGLGVANIIILIHYLGRKGEPAGDGAATALQAEKRKKQSKKMMKVTKPKAFLSRYKINLKLIAIAAGIFIILMAYGRSLNGDLNNFFSQFQIVFVSLLFSIISYLVLSKNKILFSILILVIVIGANAGVNPVSIGLSPILDKELTKLASDIGKKDPSGKWVAYGNNMLGNFLYASGEPVLNGSKFAPDLETLKILDPDLKNKTIYNRYANVQVLPNENAKDVNDVAFRLHTYDTYTIYVNPCSDKLEKIGVKYFVFSYLPKKEDLQCLAPVAERRVNGLFIYERKSLASKEETTLPASLTPASASTLFAITSMGPNQARDAVEVRGWAVDEPAKATAGGVYVEVNGKFFEAKYGVERNDIAIANQNPAYRYSGFEASVPVTEMGRGMHFFSLKILSHDKKSYYAPEQKTPFEIK